MKKTLKSVCERETLGGDDSKRRVVVVFARALPRPQ